MQVVGQKVFSKLQKQVMDLKSLRGPNQVGNTFLSLLGRLHGTIWGCHLIRDQA